MKHILIILLLIFAFCGTAWADTYYATQAGAGDKSGTEYAKAMDEAALEAKDFADGDLVYICGAWAISGSNTLALSDGGHSGTYITYDFDDGANAATVTGSGSVVFVTVSGNYMKIKDLTARGTGAAIVYTNDVEYIEIEGFDFDTTMGWFSILLLDTDHVKIFDGTGHNNDGEGVEGAEFVTIGGYHDVGTCTDIEIYGNDLKDYTHMAIGMYTHCYEGSGYAYSASEISYVNIHDNKIWGDDGTVNRPYAIVAGQVNTIHHVYIHHNWHEALRGQSQLVGGLKYIYIYENIWSNQKNCCQSSDDDGCTYGDDGTCAGAAYYGMSSPISYCTVSPYYGDNAGSYIYVLNNTFYNSSPGFIQMRLTAAGCEEIHIDNNVFVNWAMAATPEDDPKGSTVTWTDYAIAIVGDGDGPGAPVIAAAGDFTTISIESNVFYKADTADVVWYGTQAYTVAELNADLTEDTKDVARNNKSTDPSMTAPGSNDFTILDSSDAHNNGKNWDSLISTVPLVNFGITSNTLPPNALDMEQQTTNSSNWGIGATKPVEAGNEPTGELLYLELDTDLTDSSDNEDDLTDHGTITFSDNGAVFNGSDQWGTATLSNSISDISVFVTFKFDDELNDAGEEQVLAAEYDYGAGKRAWKISVADGGDGNDNLYICIGHSDGADKDCLEHGTNLVHGTKYAAALVYDTSEDDAWIWVVDASGNDVGSEATDTSLIDADTQYVGDPDFSLGAELNDGAANATELFDGTIYEVVLYDTVKTKTDLQNWVQNQLGEPAITPQSLTFTSETVSSAGLHSFKVNYDRNASLDTSGGTPSIVVDFDYPDTVTYYAIGVDGVAVVFSAYLGTKYRLSTFSDAKVGDISLNGGKIQDQQGFDSANNTISGLTYPDTDTVILIPGVFSVCSSGCDVTGIDGYNQADTDVWYYQEDTTENLTITASQMVIQGSNHTLTGTVTLNSGADNNVINCLNITGAVTDNGTGNFVRERCSKGPSLEPNNISPFY